MPDGKLLVEIAGKPYLFDPAKKILHARQVSVIGTEAPDVRVEIREGGDTLVGRTNVGDVECTIEYDTGSRRFGETTFTEPTKPKDGSVGDAAETRTEQEQNARGECLNILRPVIERAVADGVVPI